MGIEFSIYFCFDKNRPRKEQAISIRPLSQTAPEKLHYSEEKNDMSLNNRGGTAISHVTEMIPFALLPFERYRVVSCSVLGAIEDFVKNAANFFILLTLNLMQLTCLVDASAKKDIVEFWGLVSRMTNISN